MFNHLIIDTIHLDYQNMLMLNFVRSPMTSILYCRNTYSVTFRHPVLSFNLKIIQKITINGCAEVPTEDRPPISNIS